MPDYKNYSYIITICYDGGERDECTSAHVQSYL